MKFFAPFLWCTVFLVFIVHDVLLYPTDSGDGESREENLHADVNNKKIKPPSNMDQPNNPPKLTSNDENIETPDKNLPGDVNTNQGDQPHQDPNLIDVKKNSLSEICIREVCHADKKLDELTELEMGQVIGKMNEKHDTERGKVERLSQMVSLFPLRNRIDDLETRFGVANLQPGELSNFLKEKGYNVSQMIADLRKFSADYTKTLSKHQMKEIVNKGERINEKDIKLITQAVTGQEPKMSDSLADKASVHTLRYKYLFMRYADENEVKIMMEEVKKYFGGDVDTFCRELGYLFVKLSTVGVHLLPAAIDGIPVTVSLMRNGLIAHGIGDINSLNAVNVLYCTFAQKAER